MRIAGTWKETQMTFDKLTGFCLVTFMIGGIVLGYKLHKEVVCQPTVAEESSAKQIVRTVTKYITIHDKAKVERVPETVTKTVISNPKETIQNGPSSIAPSTTTRYSLGLSTYSLHPGINTLELLGSVRLWDTPLSVYSTFRPQNSQISLGVKYDF